MLVLKRKAGERIHISPAPELDPSTPVGDVFQGRAIEVMVSRIDGSAVRLGIDADRCFLILRAELK